VVEASGAADGDGERTGRPDPREPRRDCSAMTHVLPAPVSHSMLRRRVGTTPVRSGPVW
jgi:hypothetical protein